MVEVALVTEQVIMIVMEMVLEATSHCSGTSRSNNGAIGHFPSEEFLADASSVLTRNPQG